MLTLLVKSYLIGSIPFAYILAWNWSKADIRRIGSENVGTTNVIKQIGVFPGVMTAVLDACKGIIAVLVGRAFGTGWEFVALIVAMIGHIWPIWLGFHGGGGLATFIGGMLLISKWWIVLILLGVWGLAYLMIRKHDQSALIACYISPIVLGVLNSSWAHFFFGLGAAFVVGIKRIFSMRKNEHSMMISHNR